MREKTITEILKSQKIAPKKSYGQNFLSDPAILERIVSEADVTKTDKVLEIGPGPGTLTQALLKKAKSVTAVELDDRMVQLLNKKYADSDRIQIVKADILEIDLDTLMGEDYIAVANVPYYITSAIFRHLLSATKKPQRIIFTIQKEVAERICEVDGSHSLLSLSVQVYGKPRIMFHIPAEMFDPQPKVDSAVLRVDLFDTPLVDEDKLKLFFRLTKAGFSQKRKTLKNALTGGLAISGTEVEKKLIAAGIDPKRRAETLTIPEWDQLIDRFFPN